MIISEVKAMHCQKVLNAMAEKYKGSTIEQCRITMCSMFYYAAINGIIPVSPISKIVKLPKKVEKKVGSPIKNSTCDTALYKLTEKAGIDHISMHTL